MSPPAAPQPHKVDVAVRGAGVVGMALALALVREGLLEVALIGPEGLAASGDATTTADVRTWALNAASVALLQRLKVWDALPADARTAVHDMHIEGDAPGGLLQFSSWQQGSEALAWIVDAAALEAALRLALSFAPRLQRVAVSEPEPTAALRVITEGRDSASRAALGVQWRRAPYPQAAVAARLVAGHGHQGLARQWFAAPQVLALLPFDRPQPQHSYGLVWSVPPAQAEHLLGLDATGFESALQAAVGEAAWAQLGGLRLHGQRSFWPLALGQAEPVVGAGWALAGDAAHQVHPLAGQGLNLGLADVQALVATLAAREPFRALGDEILLRRYARERALANQAMAWVTDGLWQLFAHPSPLARELRNRGMGLLNQLAPLKRWLVQRALHS
jgi:2-polyprenyl-6-methoxyphenol hydroxylase-like FAD-dependent oxidoreductase